jgi:hypothetical protein
LADATHENQQLGRMDLKNSAIIAAYNQVTNSNNKKVPSDSWLQLLVLSFELLLHLSTDGKARPGPTTRAAASHTNCFLCTLIKSLLLLHTMNIEEKKVVKKVTMSSQKRILGSQLPKSSSNRQTSSLASLDAVKNHIPVLLGKYIFSRARWGDFREILI